MILLRPGSHVVQLLQLISVTGEYPFASLSLLGSSRTLSDLVRKLEDKNLIKLGDGRVVGPFRVLRVSGKIPNRTIRLNQDVIPILDLLHDGASAFYLNAFYDHHFPGNIQYTLRNHRVAEAAACFMRAGIEYRPYLLPQLQNSEIRTAIPDWPRFYPARTVKQITGDEFNKTMFSRMVGAMFYPGGQYTVYNTRSAVMRWKGRGEIKAAVSLEELARWNNGTQPGMMGTASALLFGKNPAIALDTMLETAKTRIRSNHFDSIYHHIHFIPLDEYGIRLLGILSLQDWHERMLDSLFPPEMRITSVSNFDAQRGGTFYVSHLDSDIAKLLRISKSLTSEQLEIICFPWQAGFITGLFGSAVNIRCVEMDWLEEVLGIGK